VSTVPTTVAGIQVPDSALAGEVTQFVQDVASELLFDHSRRVFFWASLQGERRNLKFDSELLAARAFLEARGVPRPNFCELIANSVLDDG
jgi:hypothetical protein